MTNRRKIWLILQAGLAFAAVTTVFLLTHRYTDWVYPGGDPDRWYHFAFSRLMVEAGSILRSLPQVEDLGWGEYFYDKEFLFHVFTALGYWLQGEAGAFALILGLSWLTFLFLTGTALPTMGAFAAAALVISLGLVNPYFSPRMMLLRPHVLAIFCFAIFLWALAKKRTWPAILGAVGFALAYHAFFVPLLVLGASAVRGVYCRDRAALRVSALTFFAFLAGSLVHPYFPANLLAGWEQIRIGLAFSNSAARFEAGNELLALSPLRFLAAFYPHIIIVCVASYLIAHQRAALRAHGELLFCFLVACGFWIMALRSPRACEYAIPATVLLAAAVFPIWPWRKQWINLGLAALVLFPSLYLWSLTGVRDIKQKIFHDSVFAAIDKIPADASGQKILNCSWYFGSPLLYARPDLRFVNVLHPMRFSQPAKYQLIQSMLDGTFADLWQGAKAFRADYVLCDSPEFHARLLRDPNFDPIETEDFLYEERLGKPFASSVALFRARREAHSAFVKRGSLGLLRDSNLTSSQFPNSDSSEAPGEATEQFESNSGFWDLNKVSFRASVPSIDNSEQYGEPLTCAYFQVAASEMERLSGAELLGVGGTPHVRLWLNGEPLFANAKIQLEPRAINALIALERPLQGKDRLAAQVCRRRSKDWSLALSLWKRAEMAALCASRAPFLGLRVDGGWRYSDTNAFDCLAPLAARLQN